jgi:hypothetical protein
MAASLMEGTNVVFYIVSVDDAVDIARRCCNGAANGAMFIPMVQFYGHANLIFEVAGTTWAHFREKVVEFVQAVQIEPEAEMPPVRTSTFQVDAEEVHSRRLESLLVNPVAEELKTAPDEHKADLANLLVLHKERAASVRPQAINKLSGQDGAVGHEPSSRRKGRLPPYAFKGTIARFLQPKLEGHLVLIYGGSRADLLEKGMREAGIDARREMSKPNQPVSIPASVRTGPPLAVVDVSEGRSPEEVRSWLFDLSDALPVGGIFATLSRDLNQLEVLGMLGETYGWISDAAEGSGADYWILALQKGPYSDELLRAADLDE